MKLFHYPITLILIGGLFTGIVFAQTSKRVFFAKNRSSAVVKGIVRGSTQAADSSCNDYLLRAKTGQTLRAKVTANAFLLIQSPTDLAVDEGITDSINKLEETGDYKIQVCNSTPRKLTYTLTVSVK